MALEFDTEKGDDIETLRERLAEAAAWFHAATGLADSEFPRSNALHPRHFQANRKSLVWWVAADRELALKTQVPVTAERIEGRVLLYAPDETVVDGASEAASDGFFNWEDEPPWDLWLGWVVQLRYFAPPPDSTQTGPQNRRAREYLVCWIPRSLVETADKGVEVNPVACIEWHEELEVALGLRSDPLA
jgi:hypothetical protein